MRCWWSLVFTLCWEKSSLRAEATWELGFISPPQMQMHYSLAKWNVCWWKKRCWHNFFFFCKMGINWKKNRYTNNLLHIFDSTYRHSSNHHPWIRPLKCVWRYEKHHSRRWVALLKASEANRKVGSPWQPELHILKRSGERGSIFFLLFHTFPLKGKIDLSTLHIMKYLHFSYGANNGPFTAAVESSNTFNKFFFIFSKTWTKDVFIVFSGSSTVPLHNG